MWPKLNNCTTVSNCHVVRVHAAAQNPLYFTWLQGAEKAAALAPTPDWGFWLLNACVVGAQEGLSRKVQGGLGSDDWGCP